MKIFTNGCFDIIHRGHIELLRYAHSLGNELIVGIDADEKIKSDKGRDRPFNRLEDRIEVLKAIRYVGSVIPFHSKSGLEALIKSIKPDILVVGSDWRDKEVVGEAWAKELLFFERVDGYSTTEIIEGSCRR